MKHPQHPLPPHFLHGQISVAVAGAGGNGSQILSGLARLHTALRALGSDGLNVTCFDPDVVSEANLGRQLFSPSDLGQFKSQVLINRLNCFYHLNWEAVCGPFDRRDRHRYHFLIGCVDSAAARRTLAQGHWDYWLDLGNTDQKGQVILGTKKRGKTSPSARTAKSWKRKMTRKEAAADAWYHNSLPTVLDLFPELKNKRRKEDTAPSCGLAEALARQDLFINQSVATFALQLLWQFIRQGGLDIHGYFINLESGRVTPLPIAPPKLP